AAVRELDLPGWTRRRRIPANETARTRRRNGPCTIDRGYRRARDRDANRAPSARCQHSAQCHLTDLIDGRVGAVARRDDDDAELLVRQRLQRRRESKDRAVVPDAPMTVERADTKADPIPGLFAGARKLRRP